MKSSRVLQFSARLILIILAISCSEENDSAPDAPSAYEWKESIISPDGLFTYARFGVGDDGHLYAFGSYTETGQRACFKYPGPNWTGNTWTVISEPNLDTFSNLETLVIYHGSIYFHVFNTLFKIEGEETTEILSGEVITGIELYKDKLVIIGDDINVSNNNFTIVTYDGTNFEPVSTELALSRPIPANDKLYIQGFPGFAFDGQSLSELDYGGYFFAVDGDENIYFGDAYNKDFTLGKKISGGYETVGHTIHGIGIPREVLLYDNTVVMVGGDDLGTTSFAYYLDNEKWIQVPTDHVIYDVVIFDNKLLSMSLDGKLFELVKK